MTLSFIGAGSNIEPAFNIETALKLLSGKTVLRGISTFYETEAIGRPGDPDYFNGVVKIETDHSPEFLKFNILRDIEKSLCRKRNIDKYAPRTIDLDILFYGGLSIHNGLLDIPDPDIKKRPYLSSALNELDTSLFFPEWGLTAREIVETFKEIKLKPLTEFTDKLRKEYIYGRQESGKAR